MYSSFGNFGTFGASYGSYPALGSYNPYSASSAFSGYGGGYSYPTQNTAYLGSGFPAASTTYPSYNSGAWSGYKGYSGFSTPALNPYARSSFTAPLTNYTPPATSFTTLSQQTPFGGYNSSPLLGATYANYSSPLTYGPRNYGAYTPYTPYTGVVGNVPFSAYGGLEKPLDLPTLALPAAPSNLPTGVLPAGIISAGAIPMGALQPNPGPAPAAPDSPVAPVACAENEPPISRTIPEGVPVQHIPMPPDYVEPPQVTEAGQNPWAAEIGEEDFDLEYSRQVAARRVIGEEEE